MSDLSDSNYIWFAIPEDGRGPSFGPVLKRSLAVRQAEAGYVVVGVFVDTRITVEPTPETTKLRPAPADKTWIEADKTRRGGWRP